MATWSTRLAALGVLGTRSIIIITVLLLLVAAGHRLDWRSDWSANRHHSLDQQLVTIIDETEQEITIVGLWPRESDQGHGALWARVGEQVEPTLELIARRAPAITYRHIDNELDLPLLEEFRAQHGNLSAGAIYVISEDQRPFRIPLSAYLPLVLQREIGGALLTIQQDEAPMVLITQGHGELQPGGGHDHGMSTLQRQWELSGFQLRPFSARHLEQLGRLPQEAIVVLAGPRNPLDANLLRALETHLRDGGRLLVLADHRLDPAVSDLLRQRGVLIGPSYPPLTAELSPLETLRSSEHYPAQLLYSVDHSTGRDGSFHRLILRPQRSFVEDPLGIMRGSIGSGRMINSTLSVPVQVLDPAAHPDTGPQLQTALRELGTPPFQAFPLLQLPKAESWIGPLQARQQPPATPPAQAGAHRLAWAITYAPDPRGSGGDREARVVVWGSRQAASDGILQGDAYANGQLLSDMLSWLADRGEQTGIPPADFKPFRVTASDGVISFILAFLVALLPCCFLGGAMITWWERR